MSTQGVSPFTPGPWQAIRLSGGFGAEGWGVIAVDPMRGRIDSQISGMSEGNARLCAAAPELLRACQLFLSAQSARRHPLGAPDEGIAAICAEAAAIARSALAKVGE